MLIACATHVSPAIDNYCREHNLPTIVSELNRKGIKLSTPEGIYKALEEFTDPMRVMQLVSITVLPEHDSDTLAYTTLPLVVTIKGEILTLSGNLTDWVNVFRTDATLPNVVYNDLCRMYSQLRTALPQVFFMDNNLRKRGNNRCITR